MKALLKAVLLASVSLTAVGCSEKSTEAVNAAPKVSDFCKEHNNQGGRFVGNMQFRASEWVKESNGSKEALEFQAHVNRILTECQGVKLPGVSQ